MMLAKLFLASIANAQILMPVPPSDSIPTPYPGLDDLQVEINEVRSQNDLPLLLSTTELTCAANRHAKDLMISRSCGHTGSDGSTFEERAKDCGTEAQAELIACGFLESQMAVSRWMRDLRSRNIIVSEDNLAMGSANYGSTWVVVFRTMAK